MSEQTDQPDPIENMFKLSKRSTTESFFYLLREYPMDTEQQARLSLRTAMWNQDPHWHEIRDAIVERWPRLAYVTWLINQKR
jgi:hypothetical protein